MNLVSREHVDIPFWNDRHVAVLDQVFDDTSLQTVDALHAELASCRVDDRTHAPRALSGERPSLPPGIAPGALRSDTGCMSAATATKDAAAGSPRLLADVKALDERTAEREPALSRLEEALGRDFADRLVSALSAHKR